jgi:hypothetical protein
VFLSFLSVFCLFGGRFSAALYIHIFRCSAWPCAILRSGGGPNA